MSCAETAYALYVERIGKKPAPMVADFGHFVQQQSVHILEVDKSLAGFIVCLAKPDHFRIENIAIHPDYQQCGYGRQLMEFAESEARASGFSRIELYTNEKMWENLKMYPVLGYHEFDRQFQDGFARVFFRKHLNN